METEIDNSPENFWPSSRPGASMQYLEYIYPGEDGPVTYRVNMSFLTSSWNCIFGQGCPSTLLKGANYNGGCCEIGTHMTVEDVEKVTAVIADMTEEDADDIEAIRKGWYDKTPKGDEQRAEFPYHTKTRDGLCVMSNRVGGRADKPGCSLHAYAMRNGISHIETKPDICWQLPFGVSEEEDNAGGTVIVVTNTSGATWGNHRIDDTDFPGWLCTESPEAFGGRMPAYVYGRDELIAQMGEKPYEYMVEQIRAEQDRVGSVPSLMPAEKMVERKFIPIAVAKRKALWQEEGAEDNLGRSTL